MTPEEFFDDLTQDILARAGAEEDFTRTTFLSVMCSTLVEEGFISEFALTEHKITSRGQAVDAWSYDDELSKLTLFLCDYRSSGNLESLTNSEVSKLFKRLRNFIDASLKDGFAESLEEADPVCELAWLIKESKCDISALNLVLLSNAQLSIRVAELPVEPVGDFKTSYDVWDFGRIFRNETSGKSREDIEIDFSGLDGGGLPCLPANTGADSMESYLLVMPGQVLADLYRDHGERLLEQNVRTFLQFRGKINKGIRNTVVNEPHMFFSYNNGLSATAEAVTTDGNSSRLLSVTNLQIVNGGQTTASVFMAHKSEKADLSRVYVQVKLSVIAPEQVEMIVPRISEYSNTQNRVNAADFFSNHPFHLRIEEFSRRLWAPSAEGSVQQTHWFYERARGQFANQQSGMTKPQREKFLSLNPRSQMFTKTDLAKFILSFEGAPHEVSLGAQKAFAGTPRTDGLVGRIARRWEKSDADFNEIWFKQAIAKAICFRELDRFVYKQRWYGGGFKANILTYTLAKFTSMVREAGRDVDFLAIWERQQLPKVMIECLGAIAELVNGVLTSPPAAGTSNVTEWAKKESCWEAVKMIDIGLPQEVAAISIDLESSHDQARDGSRTQVIQDGIHAQTYIFDKGAAYWNRLREWNREARKLSPREMGILDTACALPSKFPSEKQAPILIQAEKRAIEEGFHHQAD